MSFGPAKSPNWQNGLKGDIRSSPTLEVLTLECSKVRVMSVAFNTT